MHIYTCRIIYTPCACVTVIVNATTYYYTLYIPICGYIYTCVDILHTPTTVRV